MVAHSVTLICIALLPAEVASGSSDAPATDSRLARAQRLFMQGYYDSAIESYEPLRGDESTRLAATLGTVACYELQGRYAEGLELLDGVRRIGADSADWHEAVARFRRHIGQYRQAVEAYREALERDEAHLAARLGLGEVHEILGEKKKAVELYTFFDELLRSRLPERADELTFAARGLYRYSLLSRHPKLTERTRYVLHELLQTAYEKTDRTYWPARLAAAELLLSKYNRSEAKADFEAARSLNANLPDADVGLGRLALKQWDFDTAERHVKTALHTNPNHVGAMQLLVEVRLTERKYTDAAREADKALEVNPNDPYTLSLAAAAHLRMGDRNETAALQARIAAVNPHCGRMHFVLADWLASARQFPEAEKHYRQAIALDPEDARPRAELGLMYMQWGKEAEARAVLDEAWALDPFNGDTYNTLELLDQLESFDRYPSDHFVIHYDADKDAVLAPYFAEYLESVYAELCEDFGHEPADKTIIEVFPDHDQFAVRITGKPWIHTIGASTGRVIAMDAPRRDGSGEPFNWQRVLRHEFVHTVTLAATRNRIPHWFTEGLAVLQENAPRPYRWQQKLAQRLRRGRLFTLESIDWGFTRPRRPDDREMAYAQSEWMCEYLIGRYGYGVIHRMIVAFREDRKQDEVFRDVVKVAPAQFSEDFQGWAAEQIRSWGFRTDPIESALKLKALLLLRPSDAVLHGRLARSLLADGKVDGAHDAAKTALDLDAENVDALEVMTTLLIAAGEQLEGDAREAAYDKLEPLLTRLAEVDPSSPTPAEMFGRIALAHENHDDAVRWFERLKRLRPANPAAYHALAAIYLQRKQPDKALPALIDLWRSDENDPALPLRIAKVFEARGDRQSDAMQWYRRSMAIDPYDLEPHQALGRLYASAGQWTGAIREYRTLCTLEPTDANHHTKLALAYEKAGDLTNARAVARRAVERDPDSPAGRLLASEKKKDDHVDDANP